MSIHIASEARVRSEIWQSFDSLLRSYSAVAALDGSEPMKVQTDGDSIAVEIRNAHLGFSLDSVDGSGRWIHKTASGVETSGRFDLTLDGVMLFEGASKDLDHAAIDFVAMLGKDAEKLTVKEP